MKRCPIGVRLVGSAVLIALAGGVLAEEKYPTKTIRYIVPYAPGGSTTWTSRLVGQRLTEVWGEQVLIDNRPGASTMIGTEAAVKSRPDGYTLVYIGSALASNHTLMKTPYDARKDIAPIATVSNFETLLVIHPSLPATTVKEFIALAKARPGELNFATSSAGGATSLAAVLFNSAAGIKTQPIPYKGAGPAVTDLMGGQVHFMMGVPVNLVVHVKGGKLRGLAVSGAKRLTALPDVPSFAEAGMPSVTLASWQGVGAPAGTPKAIIDKISAEIEKLVALPETQKKLDAQGFVPFYNNPEKTAELLNADIVRFAKIIKEGNLNVQ